MIKYIALFIFFILATTHVNAQKYEISISPGLFTSSDWDMYQNTQPGLGIMARFHYQANEKWGIFSHYHIGWFSGVGHDDYVHLQAPVQTEYLSFGASRHWKLGQEWRLGLGTGIGLIYETQEQGRADGSSIQIQKKSYRDFSMPLILTVQKDLNYKISVGLTSGMYITPFYIFGGFHLAPTIGIKL